MTTKIIATTSRMHWGYRRGDVLVVDRVSPGGIAYVAQNESRPDNYGRGYALVHREDCRFADEKPRKVTFISVLAALLGVYWAAVLIAYLCGYEPPVTAIASAFALSAIDMFVVAAKGARQ
ncbi:MULTISPECIES: hypothetical protein [Paenibacillus]|uniref:hypothetical protein n=1 Tax=Paenibacillus TaxID=44249 RepID=UPI000431BCD9|nr:MULTISPECIES: hypothetical protein [Paenibacillus]CDN42050.1 hypothetical protein BN871_AT_00520 [Paenibacillus sp. P22]